MAYHVYVFAVTGDPVVQRVMPQLVDAAVERVPGTRVLNYLNYHDGVPTSDCDLVTAGHDGRIVLQVGTEPGIVKSMVEWGFRFKGSAGLIADTLLTLILIGDIDWRVVRAICEVAVHRWSGVICDEGGDSVTTLADLPDDPTTI